MGGTKFNAENLIGYNSVKKEYECTWINSLEDSMTHYSGLGKVEGDKLKSLTFAGKQVGHATGQKEVPCRAVFTFVSENRIVEELFALDKNGKEYKAVEVTYTRPAREKRPAMACVSVTYAFPLDVCPSVVVPACVVRSWPCAAWHGRILGRRGCRP
jgi:hypothetical protein